MRHLSMLAVWAVCATVSASALAAPEMQPGLWEITTKMNVPGLPAETPPQTFRHCYRAEDVKDPKKTVPQDRDCKADSVAQHGNTVTWRVSCRIEGEVMSGQGALTYAGQSYSGRAQLSGTVEGAPMQVNVAYAGERVGECK